MLGPSVIMGGVPMAFAVSIYATKKSPDCPISRTAFRSARLELVGLLVILVLIVKATTNSVGPPSYVRCYCGNDPTGR